MYSYTPCTFITHTHTYTYMHTHTHTHTKIAASLLFPPTPLPYPHPLTAGKEESDVFPTDLMRPMSRRWQSLKTLASSWKELLVTCITCSQWRLRISCRQQAITHINTLHSATIITSNKQQPISTPLTVLLHHTTELGCFGQQLLG